MRTVRSSFSKQKSCENTAVSITLLWQKCITAEGERITRCLFCRECQKQHSNMVRHKTRWLLVRLDFEGDIRFSKKKVHPSSSFPSKKDVAHSLRENIRSCFGLASEGAASFLQGRRSWFFLNDSVGVHFFFIL